VSQSEDMKMSFDQSGQKFVKICQKLVEIGLKVVKNSRNWLKVG
jgi:hypothetical protein